MGLGTRGRDLVHTKWVICQLCSFSSPFRVISNHLDRDHRSRFKPRSLFPSTLVFHYIQHHAPVRLRVQLQLQVGKGLLLWTKRRKKRINQKQPWGWRGGSVVRSLTALSEDQRSDPSIHIGKLPDGCNCSFQEPNACLWLPWVTFPNPTNTYIHK